MWVGASDGAVRLYDLEGREEKVLLSALAALPTRGTHLNFRPIYLSNISLSVLTRLCAGLRSELMDEHLLAPPDSVGDARDSLTLPRRLLSLVTFERALLVYLTQSGTHLHCHGTVLALNTEL